MSRSISLGEFLLSILALIITIGALIYGKGTEDQRWKSKVEQLEKQFIDEKTANKEKDEKRDHQIEKIDEKVDQILIILQNKEDRK